MDSQEFSGKTVAEAIEIALEQLGVTREEITVTVLKEGKSGILGIGAEEALILVEPAVTQPGQDAAGLAKQILEELLRLMGFQSQVTVEKSFVGDEDEARTPLTFNISGDDDIGILIGRHGQTMASLQYLLRVIIAHRIQESPPIIIDVDGYKQRRYDALRETARRLAEQVKLRRVPFTLEPMPPIERRVIHLTLANDPNISTQSTGEGDARKVVISPKNLGRAYRRQPNNR